MGDTTLVYLNGVSSAGKSTLAQALVDAMEAPYCLVSMDQFEGMAQRRFPLPGAMGFYDECIVPLMHHTAASFAGAGLSVVVEAVVARPEWLRDAARRLAKYRVLLVGVRCDLEELRRRERERGNRGIGKAEAQVGIVQSVLEELGGHDFEVDTTHATAEDCAALIKRRIAEGSVPKAFARIRASDPLGVPGGDAPLGRLTDVLPVAQTQERGGVAISLLALEAYEGGYVVTLRVHEPGGVPGDAARGAAGYRGKHAELAVAVTDESGRLLAPVRSMGGGGGQTDWRYAYTFRRGASSGRVRLEIRQVLWRFFGERERFEVVEGPWEFDVTLPS